MTLMLTNDETIGMVIDNHWLFASNKMSNRKLRVVTNDPQNGTLSSVTSMLCAAFMKSLFALSASTSRLNETIQSIFHTQH